jgi:acetolactate synthase I/II/III large subunit
MKEIPGSDILVELLIEQGVEAVFGYPGGAVLNIYDSLYRYADRISHVLTSHEQGAAHAADGYARATGKVGVVIATSGPGATNLVTGIATAMLDSVPMVAITGNVARPLLGKDSFQEVDIYGITMPVTKHNFIVKSVEDLAPCVRRAFAIAREGRPGPVLIDVPKDITQAIGLYVAESPKIPEPKGPRARDLEAAAALIARAKRPFVYAGGGILRSRAWDQLLAFAERVDAPVATSLMGLSSFPSGHRLYSGMVGMHGTKASNELLCDSDLLIAVGARFSDRVVSKKEGFAPDAKILHIDVDAAEVNKNVRASCHLVSDARLALEALIPMIPPRENPEWSHRVAELKAKYPLYPGGSARGALAPAEAIRAIARACGETSLVVTDVGQHQMWVGQTFPLNRPASLLTSGGMGTMGYSLGAAIGAATAIARGDGLIAGKSSRVLCFVGDGGFRMNCNELATIAQYDLPIVVVLMNNGCLGMVRQWQRFFYGERYSHTTLDRPPDFVALAKAFGLGAWRADSPESLEGALAKALESPRPSVLECLIDKDELVLPMVPPGAAITEQKLV